MPARGPTIARLFTLPHAPPQARCSEVAAELAAKLLGALWADVSQSVAAAAADSEAATKQASCPGPTKVHH